MATASSTKASDFMKKIIVDSCAWKAISQSSINIDIELKKVLGNSEMLTCKKVEFELEDIEDLKYTDKKLMMQLFYRKVNVVEDFESKNSHTDDQLLELSELYSGILFTVDRKLKDRAMKKSIPILEIVQANHLRLVEH